MDSTKLKLQNFDISDTTKRLIELSRKRIESDLLSSQAAVEAVAIEKLWGSKDDNYQESHGKIEEKDNITDNKDIKDIQDTNQNDLGNTNFGNIADEKNQLVKEQQSKTKPDDLKIPDESKTDLSPSLDEVHKIVAANATVDNRLKVSGLNVQTPFSDTLIQNLEARININESNEFVSSYMANKDIFSRFVQFKIQKTLAKNKTFKEGSMCYQADEESDSSDTGFGNFGELKKVDSQYSTILAGLLTSRYYDEKSTSQNNENKRVKSEPENEKQIHELPAYRRFKVLIELKKRHSEKLDAKFEEETEVKESGKKNAKQKVSTKKRNSIEPSNEIKKSKKIKKKAIDKSLGDEEKADQNTKIIINPQEQSNYIEKNTDKVEQTENKEEKIDTKLKDDGSGKAFVKDSSEVTEQDKKPEKTSSPTMETVIPKPQKENPI